MTKRKVKFESGDRVLVDADTDAPGRSGTVVRYESDGDVVVSFRGGGWTDDGGAKHCWYIEPKCLKSADAPKLKPTQEYLGNDKHSWEQVTPTSELGVNRLRVPGGWLYAFSIMDTMTFVPMPEVVKHKV